MGAHNYGEKKQTFQSAGTSHLEVRDCLLNNIREEVVHFFVRHAAQVVIARIHHQPPVEECPCQIVHRILLGLDRATDNLRVVVVVQNPSERRLDRKRFVQKLAGWKSGISLVESTVVTTITAQDRRGTYV